MTCDDPGPENAGSLRAEREEALRELDAVLAEIGHERLIAWAEANRPPRSWSDEDPDGLLGDGDPP